MSNSGNSFEPSFQFAVCTPSDTANLTYTNADGIVEEKRCKALYIGGAGDVAVLDDAGNSVVFTAMTAGGLYPISTSRVLSTGTTATNLCVLY